jgi:hypothetical protein
MPRMCLSNSNGSNSGNGNSDCGNDDSNGSIGGDGESGKDNNQLKGAAEEMTVVATVMAAKTAMVMEMATVTVTITMAMLKPTMAHRQQQQGGRAQDVPHG